MFDFQQKRKLRAIINSPFTQGTILLFALFVAWSAYVRYDIAMEMRERRIQAELQATALETQQTRLQEQVEYLSSERGIEAELRRQFGVAFPGEQVVVITDEKVLEIEGSFQNEEDHAPEKKPWYKFWNSSDD